MMSPAKMLRGNSHNYDDVLESTSSCHDEGKSEEIPEISLDNTNLFALFQAAAVGELDVNSLRTILESVTPKNDIRNVMKMNNEYAEIPTEEIEKNNPIVKKEDLNEEPTKICSRRSGIPKQDERRRQMEKNREYARKCVQKKKEQRRHAEIRSQKMSEAIENIKKDREWKERNADFAVFLGLKAITDKNEVKQLEEHREKYENEKKTGLEQWKQLEGADETVNINYFRLETAKEEFRKASDDLRDKNGVIGTLGSRKIRAKQHMEWRTHLYNLSLFEHHIRREKHLLTLVENYVNGTVPRVTQLLSLDSKQCSISKELLDELIKTNRGAQLGEFVQFVQQRSQLAEIQDRKETDDDNEDINSITDNNSIFL